MLVLGDSVGPENGFFIGSYLLAAAIEVLTEHFNWQASFVLRRSFLGVEVPLHLGQVLLVLFYSLFCLQDQVELFVEPRGRVV